MPHAVPRERSFDFYTYTRPAHKVDSACQMPQMQLPVPRFTAGSDLDVFRNGPRPPLTPPGTVSGSAVRVVSLSGHEGAGHEYGYQLPAIGNSRTVTTHTSPTPQKQPQQSSQDMGQSQRKKWTISPNLRVPSTISTPQEGLPQLAAEVSLVIVK